MQVGLDLYSDLRSGLSRGFKSLVVIPTILIVIGRTRLTDLCRQISSQDKTLKFHNIKIKQLRITNTLFTWSSVLILAFFYFKSYTQKSKLGLEGYRYLSTEIYLVPQCHTHEGACESPGTRGTCQTQSGSRHGPGPRLPVEARGSALSGSPASGSTQ